MIPILSAAFMGAALFLFGFVAGHGHSGWLRRREAREARRRDKEYDQFCRLQRMEIRLQALEDKKP